MSDTVNCNGSTVPTNTDIYVEMSVLWLTN
jgi:hypothetical protein